MLDFVHLLSGVGTKLREEQEEGAVSMTKAAIVVLADTETHADLGRIANALTSAKEFKEAGDEITIVFDGAGTKWVAELSTPDHRLHKAFESVKDVVAGACSYCA